MRVNMRGVGRSGKRIGLQFEGRDIDAYAGETVAAALLAAGVVGLREARDGSQRGLFCGMGVCGECTLSIDGIPRRACLEPVREGMVLHRQPALAQPGPNNATTDNPPWQQREVDVLVVGAGPAGLSAARTAAAAGASVLVADERLKAGGQYFKQPGEGFDIDEASLDRQFAEGRALARSAAEQGVEFLFGASVWGAFGERGIGLLTERECVLVRARQLVISPGAYERPLPVPGWTLPGVMTTGCAQTLLRAYQTAPGKRVLIAGNGPLNLQVAHELARAGAEVVAVAELAPAPAVRAGGKLARMAMASPALVTAGIGHVAALWHRNVPVLHQHVLIEVAGGERVRRARIAQVRADGSLVPGSERSYDIDAVCMGYGFVPQSELARAVGCEHRWDAARGALIAVRDTDGHTNVPGVYVAGDAGALGGARVALAQGVLAGIAAAQALGLAPDKAQRRAVTRARRIAARHLRFQSALWQLYRAPLMSLQLSRPDTPICRCESVDLATLKCHLESDGEPASLGAVKRLTRAGMGRCQGRYCSVLLAELAHATSATGDEGFLAPRSPFKPTPIGKLAARGEVRLRTPMDVENKCTL